IEIAARVLAKGGWTVHRADISRDLRGALGGDPRAAIEAQREHFCLHEIGKEILPLQGFAFTAVDVAAGDRLPDSVVIGVDRIDRRPTVERGSARKGDRALPVVPAVI